MKKLFSLITAFAFILGLSTFPLAADNPAEKTLNSQKPASVKTVKKHVKGSKLKKSKKIKRMKRTKKTVKNIKTTTKID